MNDTAQNEPTNPTAPDPAPSNGYSQAAQANQSQTSNPVVSPATQVPDSSPQTTNSNWTPPAQNYTQDVHIVSPDDALADKPPRKSSKMLFAIGVAIIILLIGSTATLTLAVAYEKIHLKNYPQVQQKIAGTVMSLPFMPKTPKFLLAKTILAHENLTKHSFDISIAVDSKSLASALALGNLDGQIKGDVDYTDEDNIRANVDVALTRDFAANLRTTNNILYFKLTKVPTYLLSLLGMNTSSLEPVLDKWVSYDVSKLDTPARSSLKQDEEQSLTQQYLSDFNDKYIDERILDKLVVEKVTDDGFTVYKLALNADADLIDHLQEIATPKSEAGDFQVYSNTNYQPPKLSDTVKSLHWDIYIDAKTYYTRKIAITTKIQTDEVYSLYPIPGSTINPLAGGDQEVNVAFALKLGNFGEDVPVDIPADVLPIEQFTSMIYEAVTGRDYAQVQSTANDQRRKSDLITLTSALFLYNTDCKRYPGSLDALLADPALTTDCSSAYGYIDAVPTDPTGSDYYYNVSADGQSYDLCANLDTPADDLNACPDPNYNYNPIYQDF